MSAPLPFTHACPGGCDKQVEHTLFACKPCWFRLPQDVRRAISRSYGVNAMAHDEAMARACDWYTEHPRRVKPPPMLEPPALF